MIKTGNTIDKNSEERKKNYEILLNEYIDEKGMSKTSDFMITSVHVNSENELVAKITIEEEGSIMKQKLMI